MKFSPCTSQCTCNTTHCDGCGRSIEEINESKALVENIVEHLKKYNYDDPENFLKMLTNKSLNNLSMIK